MDKKMLALVSYITIIGWLISFFSYQSQEKNSFVTYHLKQSFGLFISFLVYGVLVMILMAIITPFFWRLALTVGTILNLGYLALFVLMIIGILNASKEEEKPLPYIGKLFEGKFSFIP
jgi:uncharacterized membrane protein